jgi:hypothetical protein
MKPMSTAPRNETTVLLKHSIHGWIEAYFSPGSWSETHNGREYSGSVWVCGDDLCQIEAEEIPGGGFDEPEALGWMEVSKG